MKASGELTPAQARCLQAARSIWEAGEYPTALAVGRLLGLSETRVVQQRRKILAKDPSAWPCPVAWRRRPLDEAAKALIVQLDAQGLTQRDIARVVSERTGRHTPQTSVASVLMSRRRRKPYRPKPSAEPRRLRMCKASPAYIEAMKLQIRRERGQAPA